MTKTDEKKTTAPKKADTAAKTAAKPKAEKSQSKAPAHEEKKASAKTKSIKVDKDVLAPKPGSVDAGHFVSVEYVGKLDNGEEFDNSSEHGPIQFVVGASQVIKGFDDAVRGMKLGQEKTFKINKEDAYGDINPQLVHQVPIAMIPEHIKSQLKVGGFLVMQSPIGQQIPAKVTAVEKDSVTLDVNHPLAGKNLTFSIKIVDITHPPHDHDHDHEHEDIGCDDDACSSCAGCGDHHH